jgi:hypothetical protein
MRGLLYWLWTKGGDMRFLVFLVMMVFPTVCSADLYVLVDKTTNEVITVSEKNDSVPSENQEVKKIKGSIEDFKGGENPTNYKLSDKGKFVKNQAKIDSLHEIEVINEEKEKEETLIQKKIRQQAIDSLKAEGVNFKYIEEATDGKEVKS